ncbi:MAG: deoxynucleoside kinase [Ignavibacteriales bacterium]|nr:MAG: deoxynucleoside kinase [Ignavibacteriaceae bacterium]MBW7872724.1 deoxynucleoside kinase [Ignavibacteria bacterium]MCZ2143444.1 deoxynucleoside kinase [Ignavibacteriales bacterium]OQY73815.1 MAG: deoxynucleoside kinase [Ignavibacteriales bacterium UTCHB3]MBV6444321.1 Deoxyguanosine kinase [Ignavibacteriaceae bacterium]
MNREINYIAVEGVIGVGKTSLVRRLQAKLNARMILENHAENPFLAKFYKNKKRYAFQTQMFFLISRYKQLEDLGQESLFTDHIVADYIFDKDLLFAWLNLDKEELQLYNQIFPKLARNLRKPDLVVFLKSEVPRLLENIRRRNRSYELDMDEEYIANLDYMYNEYFMQYTETPLLIVNTTDLDFVYNDHDFEEIYNQIFREDRARVEYFQPESRELL